MFDLKLGTSPYLHNTISCMLYDLIDVWHDRIIYYRAIDLYIYTYQCTPAVKILCDLVGTTLNFYCINSPLKVRIRV